MVQVAERIRVVLAEMPPLLRDIVNDTLRRAPDVVVVGEVGRGGALRRRGGALRRRGGALHRTLARTKPDVVIVGTAEPRDFSLPRQVLVGAPLTRVLMLAVGGRNAVMYELQPHRTALGAVSPQALIDAIRARAGRAAWDEPI